MQKKHLLGTVQKLIPLESPIWKSNVMYIAFLEETCSITSQALIYPVGQRWGNSLHLHLRDTFELIDFLHITQFVTDPLLEFCLLT